MPGWCALSGSLVMDISKVIGTAVLLTTLCLAGCQPDDDDDVGHNPSMTGGGTTATTGGTSSGGGDDEDGGGLSDASDIGEMYDVASCREAFVQTAVTNTVWYALDCVEPDPNVENDCRPGSAATEYVLDLREDGTYWFNVITYESFDNKQNYSGYCRDPQIRDGELTWELRGCEAIALTTGCGDAMNEKTEGAFLTDEGMRLEGINGAIDLEKVNPQALREGRMSNPLGPSGCFDDTPASEPNCK